MCVCVVLLLRWFARTSCDSPCVQVHNDTLLSVYSVSLAVSYKRGARYRMLVHALALSPGEPAAVAWDSGGVESSDPVAYVGTHLAPDTAYSVVVMWWDDTDGVSGWSDEVNFTSAWFAGSNENGWNSTQWLDGSVDKTKDGGMGVSQARASFRLEHSSAVAFARLYVATPGYCKCWVNGMAVSNLDVLGHHTTTEARIL